MTRGELMRLLDSSRLFTLLETETICHTIGTYTLGNAIIACSPDFLNIELAGSDVDILIGCLNDQT